MTVESRPDVLVARRPMPARAAHTLSPAAVAQQLYPDLKGTWTGPGQSVTLKHQF